MPPITANGGMFQGAITDYQSCFNLNNLVINNTPQAEPIKIFKNLLQQKKLDEKLLWSLIDWIDSNDEPKAQGAEWETYSQYTPPYRPANQPLTELSELHAVAYWTHEAIQTLDTDICALPTAPEFKPIGRYFPVQTKITPLNINTISPVILKALSAKMHNANLEKIILTQQEEGFSSVQDFFDKLDADNQQNPKLSSLIKAELLSVDSHYFKLYYTGWMGNLTQRYYSLLYRNTNTNTIDTLYRSRFY